MRKSMPEIIGDRCECCIRRRDVAFDDNRAGLSKRRVNSIRTRGGHNLDLNETEYREHHEFEKENRVERYDRVESCFF